MHRYLHALLVTMLSHLASNLKIVPATKLLRDWPKDLLRHTMHMVSLGHTSTSFSGQHFLATIISTILFVAQKNERNVFD